MERFMEWRVAHVHRQANDVAHSLAKFALSLQDEQLWMADFPSSVSTFTNTIIRHRNLPKHHQTPPSRCPPPTRPSPVTTKTPRHTFLAFNRRLRLSKYPKCATNRRRLAVNQKPGKN
ncbi:hypothetical protein FH972_001529 [Carpinus fangiana]|uniref:RNase H type-1 domain-containing protein n=1 Tax=Carpinus fangiana TaxID=176857 RepID=A0A5N6QFA2_9ROSI|nr:hypothetical protein FH972_001529 [Carpinus fangiana]